MKEHFQVWYAELIHPKRADWRGIVFGSPATLIPHFKGCGYTVKLNGVSVF